MAGFRYLSPAHLQGFSHYKVNGGVTGWGVEMKDHLLVRHGYKYWAASTHDKGHESGDSVAVLVLEARVQIAYLLAHPRLSSDLHY